MHGKTALKFIDFYILPSMSRSTEGHFLSSLPNKTLYAFLICTSALRLEEDGKLIKFSQNFFIIWLRVNLGKLLQIVSKGDSGPHPLVTSSSRRERQLCCLTSPMSTH